MGDYPAFFAAGQLSQTRDLKKLYSTEAQKSIQAPLIRDGNSYLEFAYPPFVALAFEPIAKFFSPFWGKVLLMLQLTGLLLLISNRFAKENCIGPDIIFSAAICFFPTFSSIAGAQNSVISLAILIGIVSSLSKENPKSDFLAGLLLGVWLFKPQFALVALALLVIRGVSRHFISGFLSFAFAIYCVTALYFSPDWPVIWLQSAIDFSSREAVVNYNQHISIFALARTIGFEGAPSYLIWISVGLLASFQFYKLRSDKKLGVSSAKDLYLLGPAIIALSPHCLYYEATLLLPALGMILLSRNKQGSAIFACVIWILSALACLFKEDLFIQPLALAAILTLVNSKPVDKLREQSQPTHL